jgi:hypothetical protein
MTPNVDTTPSNVSSANGSLSASPIWYPILNPALHGKPNCYVGMANSILSASVQSSAFLPVNSICQASSVVSDA